LNQKGVKEAGDRTGQFFSDAGKEKKPEKKVGEFVNHIKFLRLGRANWELSAVPGGRNRLTAGGKGARNSQPEGNEGAAGPRWLKNRSLVRLRRDEKGLSSITSFPNAGSISRGQGEVNRE